MSGEVLFKRFVSPGADQPYWDGLAEGRLVMPRCQGCGRQPWPAVWRCGECGSWERVWSEIEPVGTIYTWCRTWHPFPGLERFSSPFVSLVVEIAGTGGRRLSGLLEGAEAGVRIGAKVRGRVAEIAVAGEVLPALRWSLDEGDGR